MIEFRTVIQNGVPFFRHEWLGHRPNLPVGRQWNVIQFGGLFQCLAPWLYNGIWLAGNCCNVGKKNTTLQGGN